MINYFIIDYINLKEDKICLESGINYIKTKDVENINKIKLILFNGSSISLSEGIPHIFNYTINSKYSHYSYYIVNKENSAVINLYLLDKTYNKIYIKIIKREFVNY